MVTPLSMLTHVGNNGLLCFKGWVGGGSVCISAYKGHCVFVNHQIYSGTLSYTTNNEIMN